LSGQGSTLQAVGTLSQLNVSFFSGMPILDLGGTAAATLTTSAFQATSSGNLRINFGIGSGGSDFWAINSILGSLPSKSGTFQFEFQNLGGVTTSIDYPLMSVPSFVTPSASIFAFAPDMAAAGWAGTFKTIPGSASVRFTSVPVPEPSTMMPMLLGGTALAFAARRSRGKRHLPKRRD
jgi:hypothetical protein